MDQETFEQYYKRSLMEYAYEHIRAGNWKEDEAIQNAQAEFERLLPEGLRTKEHMLFSVLHKEESIGILWLHIFAHNQRAKALYENMGYEITNYHMKKRLS